MQILKLFFKAIVKTLEALWLLIVVVFTLPIAALSPSLRINMLLWAENLNSEISDLRRSFEKRRK